MSESQERKIDVSIEVSASVEAVWNAVSTAEGLMTWFPPYARVTDPGVGGKIWLSWGGGVEGEGVIEVWEPNSHLRVVESSGMVVDYFIANAGQGAVLRIVHSGFSASSDWDDTFEGASGGWAYFVCSLKHYLERHAGKVRHLISTRRKMLIPRAEAWPLVLGTFGLAFDAAQWVKDQPYHGHIGDQHISGTIALCTVERNFGGTVRELNDGLLFVELEAGEPWHCGVWLSVFGDDVNANALQAELERALNNAFSQSEAHPAAQ